MDVCKAISVYMERMVKEVHGMKILLLDDHTVRCLQTEHDLVPHLGRSYAYASFPNRRPPCLLALRSRHF